MRIKTTVRLLYLLLPLQVCKNLSKLTRINASRENTSPWGLKPAAQNQMKHLNEGRIQFPEVKTWRTMSNKTFKGRVITALNINHHFTSISGVDKCPKSLAFGKVHSWFTYLEELDAGRLHNLIPRLAQAAPVCLLACLRCKHQQVCKASIFELLV